MNIRFRKATTDDSSRVAEILCESRKVFLPFAPSAHTDEENRNWVKDVLIPEAEVFLAEDESKILGVIAISRKEGVSWINQLYLDPLYVGMGIGTKTMDYILSFTLKPIRLYTFQENHGARRFYERFGFKALNSLTARIMKKNVQMYCMSFTLNKKCDLGHVLNLLNTAGRSLII